jgi:hypothetical protein
MREALYNGIRLPESWPPRADRLTPEPQAVPYLTSPPALIPIDVGRQLFVDDFLIAQTTLRRVFHLAEYHPANPVLVPDRPWEKQLTDMSGDATAAMPFSGGVWYDPADGLFKLFYMGGFMLTTCLATSRDGIHWDKPALTVEPGTNVVLREGRERNRTAAAGSTVVWLDHDETNPQRRYKLFAVIDPTPGVPVLTLRTSPDGIHWSPPLAQSAPLGDRTTVFYNPFLKKWIQSRRDWREDWGRYRRYVEHLDPVELVQARPEEAVVWVGSDRLDPPRLELNVTPQLYTLDCVAYESLLLGAFSLWRGEAPDGTKRQDVCLGFSRDGFHWSRPDRRPFLANAECPDAWNWGYMHAAGGLCLVVGDKLHVYACGRSPVPGGARGTGGARVYRTGLATLRRDGFAALEGGEAGGSLTTRPLLFSGRYLFVNAASAHGEIRVEALDEQGQPIAPFTAAACAPVGVDRTRIAVVWADTDSLAPLAGRPVRFRFHVRRAALYSFWVSPDRSGASYGYTAAGGPGIPGARDTLGAEG